jgi:hypothetical protein
MRHNQVFDILSRAGSGTGEDISSDEDWPSSWLHRWSDDTRSLLIDRNVLGVYAASADLPLDTDMLLGLGMDVLVLAGV